MPARPRSGWTGDWPRKPPPGDQLETHRLCAEAVIHAALLAHDEVWDWDPISSFREAIVEDRPDDWVLEAWYPGKPGKTQKRAVASLFAGKAPKNPYREAPDADWLVLSQQEVEPIRARAFPGPNPRIPPSPAAVNSVIPRSPAIRN